MPGMPAFRILSAMLRALGYAALPSWPLGITAAVVWPLGVEMLLLTVAVMGSWSALGLRYMRWAEERARRRAAEYQRLAAEREAQYERLLEQRNAQAERLERWLVGAVSDLHPRGRGSAMTRPDLRVVR